MEDVTTEVEVDSGVDSGDAGIGDAEIATGDMQSTDPDAPNFDYDKWAENQGLRKPSPESLKERAKSISDDDKGEDETKVDKSEETDQKEAGKGEGDKKVDDSKGEKSGHDEPQKFELKVKVDGSEKTISDPEEAKALIQKGMASDQRFYQANKIMSETKEVLETLKTDPGKIFSHPQYGQKFIDAATDYLYEHYRIESLPPEQQEAEYAKRENAQLKAQMQQRQQQEQAQKTTEMTNHYRQQFTNGLVETLKISGLPDTQDNRLAIVNRMKASVSKGIPIDPKQIASDVRSGFDTNLNQSFANMSVEQLIQAVGKENVDKIRKHQIQQIKSQQSTTMQKSRPQVINKSADSQSGGRGKKSYSSAADMMDDIM